MPSRTKPKVSILLPVRDAASTLPECLESIRRQTLEDWECLVVDDGSTDGTLSIVRQAAAADPRFRLLAGSAEGLIAALNRGLEECSGQWTARMDGDDLMQRDRLRWQVRSLAENPVLAGVGCHVRMFPRNSLGEGMRGYESWLNRLETPGMSLPPHGSNARWFIRP